MANARTSCRWFRGVFFGVFLALGAASALPALGESLDRRFYVGVSTGLYLPADQTGGGFRFTSTGEDEVKVRKGLQWQGIVGYGIPLPPPKDKPRRRMGLAVELDVRYLDMPIGDETLFHDPDASTIQHIPIDDPAGLFSRTPGRTLDEKMLSQRIGRIQVVPVLADAVLRFGVQKKTTAFVGGGVGWAFTTFDTDQAYRDFVGYEDGKVSSSFALNLKGGIDVALTKHFLFNFTGDFLMISDHFQWSGVHHAFGTQNFDLQTKSDQAGYGIPDIYGRPADYRLADPGNLRLDGLTFAVGFRWVFGSEKKPAEPAKETAAPAKN